MTDHSHIELRRRVLFLLPNLRGGGAERVVVTLLRILDRSKFQLSLGVVDLQGAVYLDDLLPDVELIDLRCTRVRQALPGMVRLIRDRHPDLVFSTLGHLNLALGMVRWALPSGTHLVGREATILSRMVEGMPFAWFWKLAYGFFYRRFDRIVCQSWTMRQDLIEAFRVPAEAMAVIHNPLDIERVHSLAEIPETTPWDGEETPVIRLVTAGRLSHEKGYDLLIEALAQCGNPRLRLTILGDGPLRRDLENLVSARGLDAQVRFLGFQKNPYPYFKEADAFIMSSRYEGFPNVVIEAMACGTPVISTPLGPVKEILSLTGGGTIADAFTAEALAKAINSVQVGQRIPPGAVEPFAAATILKEYTQLLLEVVRPCSH